MTGKRSLLGTLHETTHHGRTWNHAPARRPRVLVARQRRVAAFFGREL